jgi:peptidoglycan hydrolase CwlO-like protein
MPGSGEASFEGLDATVVTRDNQPEKDPVEAVRTLLAEADEQVERLTCKYDKVKGTVASSKESLDEAKAEQKRLKQELAALEKERG